jgi:hypothetical protein
MGCSSAEATQDEDFPVDWVQAYETNQSEHSFDILLNCWARQWPGGVKAQENAPPSRLATERDISAAIVATRKNCGLEMDVRLDQINVDLAREGMQPPEIHAAAQRQIATELDEMFVEYWSRL